MPEIRQDPIDTLERLANLYRWEHCRRGENLFVQLHGSWSEYMLHGCWDSQSHVLHLLCGLDWEVPLDRVDRIYHLLGRINEGLWLGNFVYSSRTGRVHFRLSLLSGDGDARFVRRLQEMLTLLCEECDRFYPGIQQVAWANVDVDSALRLLKEPGRGLA